MALQKDEVLQVAAEFSLAAYTIGSEENVEYNKFNPYAFDLYDAQSDIWEYVDLSETLTEGEMSETVEGLFFNENAAALIARGDTGDGETLVISFRGTNDFIGPDDLGEETSFFDKIGLSDGPPDVQDWTNMDRHYALLDAFVSAAIVYAAEEGIDEIILTGHSLGAAMVEAALKDQAALASFNVTAVNFASPGYGFDLLGREDPRLTSYYTPGDIIQLAELFADNIGNRNEFEAFESGIKSSDQHEMNLYLELADFLSEIGATNEMINSFKGSYELSGHIVERTYDTSLGIDFETFGYEPASTDVAYFGTASDDKGVFWTGGSGNDNYIGFNNIVAPDSTTNYSDIVFGYTGNDLLNGGSGLDTLYGGDGEDHLLGGKNSDTLFGGFGNDTLEGNSFSDYLYGDESNDLLKGGDEDDYLFGGRGDDDIFGGTGDDDAYGGRGNDTLSGESGLDWLYGGRDDDILYGGANSDLLYGGAENDIFFGGEGADLLDGGEGFDLVDYSKETEGIHINLRSSKNIGASEGDQFVSIEGIIGTEFDDFFSTRWNAELYAEGHAGNDRFYGSSKNDEFYGGEGNDILNGNTDGTDLLFGGIGNDRIVTVKGDGSLLYGGDDDDHIYGGAGNNFLYGGNDKDRLFIFSGPGADLFGGDGEDSLFGGTGNDFLHGDEGNDTLRSGDGNDILNGGNGSDFIMSELGDDRMFGGTGNDYLLANSGSTQMTGGEGSDSFIFVASGDVHHSTIYDFEVGTDSLVLINFGSVYDISVSDLVLTNALGPVSELTLLIPGESFSIHIGFQSIGGPMLSVSDIDFLG